MLFVRLQTQASMSSLPVDGSCDPIFLRASMRNFMFSWTEHTQDEDGVGRH